MLRLIDNFFCFICTGMVLVGCASVPSSRIKAEKIGEIRTVAVLPFTDAPGADAGNSGRVVAGAISASALGINGWKVIDKSHLQFLTGGTDIRRAATEDIMRIGRGLGVDAVIVGNVSQYEIGSIPFLFFLTFDKNIYRVSYSLRMIDVRSGEIYWAGSATGNSLRSLEDSTLIATEKLFSQLDGIAFNKKTSDNTVVSSLSSDHVFRQYASPSVDITGRRFALLIGIDTYLDPDINNLKFAERDINALHDVLVSYAGYDPKNVIVMLTSDPEPRNRPTRNNILMALQWLSMNLSTEDSLMIMYCGHGDTHGDVNFLVPMDGKKSLLEDTAIRFSRLFEWLDRCEAGSQMVFIDSCHSGGLASNERGSRGMQVVSTSINKEMDRYVAAGRAVVTSSSRDEVSYECVDLQHGVFSYFLIQGLSSSQADLNGDRILTVYEIGHYLRQKVSEWCRDHRKVPSQTPRLRFNDLSGEIKIMKISDQANDLSQ